MNRPGDCYDNAVIESCFGTHKQEWAYHHRWAGLADARAATYDDFEVFYNRQRLHSALGYRTPASECKAGPRRGQHTRARARTRGWRPADATRRRSPQVVSLLPLDLHHSGALPPNRRAALELRMAPLRAAPPILGKGEHFPKPLPLCTLVSSSTQVSEEPRRGSDRPVAGVLVSPDSGFPQCRRLGRLCEMDRRVAGKVRFSTLRSLASRSRWLDAALHLPATCCEDPPARAHIARKWVAQRGLAGSQSVPRDRGSGTRHVDLRPSSWRRAHEHCRRARVAASRDLAQDQPGNAECSRQPIRGTPSHLRYHAAATPQKRARLPHLCARCCAARLAHSLLSSLARTAFRSCRTLRPMNAYSSRTTCFMPRCESCHILYAPGATAPCRRWGESRAGNDRRRAPVPPSTPNRSNASVSMSSNHSLRGAGRNMELQANNLFVALNGNTLQVDPMSVSRKGYCSQPCSSIS